VSEYHVPVLAEEVVHFLMTDPGGLYVDATVGGGGHARVIAERLGTEGLLLGVDRDPEALAAAGGLELRFPGRVRLIQGDFGRLAEILAHQGCARVQGVFLDLGVSSRQLDRAERGFSFLRDGPLDMRMDPASETTAADIVNCLAEDELSALFRELGEESRAARVARAVAAARARSPIRRTGELARVVEEALGRRGHKHPATRVFQALRIAVNRELESLDLLLRSVPALLAPGGRIVVISYHSLEDRRVKHALRDGESQCRCAPASARCTCGRPGWARVLTRKAAKPGREEIAANPRARSARLRAAERLPLSSGAFGPPGVLK
jgi:16S rRNA (cytosine1402-N4)-methyltransferase